MALVNPNIAMSVKPLEIPQRNALAEAAQVMNLQQAQMQMEKLRQTDEAMERIRQAAVKNGGPGDLNEIAQAFLQSPDLGHQQLGLRIREQQREKKEFETMGRKLYPQLFGAAPATATAPVVESAIPPVEPTGVQVGAPIATPNVMAAPLTAPRNAMATPTVAPAPVAAPANVSAANALVAPGAAQQLSPSGKTRQELEGLIFMAQRNPLFKGMAETAKLELAEMMKTPPDISTMRSLGYPLTKEGYAAFRDAQRQERMLSPTEEAQKIRIALASRPPAAAATPAAPVAVVGEDGKVRYASREEAIGKGMTPASAFEGITPKEIQKREAALPAATSAVKGFESKSESFVKDLAALRNHPGLSEITGLVAGRVPGITDAGRAAQALYDKVVAKGGFQALQDLRDASKTGGALGNVSNQEGKQLTASFAAIDRRQNVKDVQAALDAAIADVEGARTRMREAYDDTYKYKTERGGAAPAKSAPDPLGIR